MSSIPPAAQQCEHCHSIAGPSYFMLGSHVLCSACAPQFAQAGVPSNVGRSLLYGAATAFACTLLLMLIPNIAIVLTILAGFAVAKAMRTGAGGLGARNLQVVAVLLTYAAVTLCRVPTLVQEVDQQRIEVRETSTLESVALIGSLSAVALVAPLLELPTNPVGGLIGLLFILLGLMNTWRMTRGITDELTGPFQAEAPA